MWAPGQIASVDDPRAKAQGLIAQNLDRSLVSSGAIMVGGTAYAQLVELNGGDVISNLLVACNVAGTATTLFLAGVYSADGTVEYASTSDQSAQFATTGVKTLPLSAPWTVPKTGAYLVVVVSTATTTLPTLLRGIQGAPTAAAQVAGAAPPFSVVGTGLAGLPATPLVFSTVATTCYWTGLN